MIIEIGQYEGYSCLYKEFLGLIMNYSHKNKIFIVYYRDFNNMNENNYK